MPPNVRKFIARRALRTQVVNKPGRQYYSAVRFQFDTAALPAPQVGVRYRLPAGLRAAFSYGVQEEAQAAGFPAGYRPSEVETNLIWFECDRSLGTAKQVGQALREKGVLVHISGPTTLRACTHLDVSAAQCERAAELIRQALRRVPARV